jgi:hypothetical protein
VNRTHIHWWLAGSVLLALAVAPFLARGDQQSRETRRRHHEQIEKMSLSERERLERNWAIYRQLAPQRRDALHAFHQQIERDRSEGDGELAQVMEDYYAWLRTIDPIHRDQLNQTTDPSERLRLMRKFAHEKRARSVARWIPRGPGRPGRGRDIPSLSSEELARVMEEIEKMPPSRLSRLSTAEREELNQLQGVDRYVRVLEHLKRLEPRKGPLLFDPLPEFSRLASRFDAVVENSAAREYVAESDSQSSRDRRVARLLVNALSIEHVQQRRRQGREPSTAELEEYFSSLPDDEQDEMLILEASDFHADLLNRYPQQTTEVSMRTIGELFFPPPDASSRSGRGRPPGSRTGRDGRENGDRSRDREPDDD